MVIRMGDRQSVRIVRGVVVEMGQSKLRRHTVATTVWIHVFSYLCAHWTGILQSQTVPVAVDPSGMGRGELVEWLANNNVIKRAEVTTR